jgi:DNA invertase Pin-like site-specific DNA recombinase
MKRLSRSEMKIVILNFMLAISLENRRKFLSLGKGRLYTDEQKNYVFRKLGNYGVRATAKMLNIPRRTLQRWCRKYDVDVRRCPEWVYGWAERRKRRKAFWARHGDK